MVAGAPFSQGAIEAWIIAHLAADFALDPAALDPTAPFEQLGLASREVVMLSGDLEEWLGLTLSPVLLYEYPSIRALAGHLATLKQPLAAPEPAAAATAPAAPASNTPIAIIGLAARFPGADDAAAFWQALVAGQDCIRLVPEGRWDAAQVAAQLAGKKPLGRWGGFLDRVDEFDAGFFGISGREAAHLDPQQRLLLEVTWEALADAGLPVGTLAGRPVGAYVGISSSEYGQAQLGRLDQINGYVGTGSALSIAANRLSYFFDWRGPSVAVDTACSSSLVALHLAVRALRAGETQLAVVAGTNLILSPAVTVNFNEAGAMAADGRCKAFDARADGYVRSEGVGVVVLKPLAQAQADGDRIYAVILGTAVNQDGRTNGLMAPNPRAQEEVLRAAYQDAGVAPSAVSYVEAHGTGTLLGDPIEAQALAAVRQSDPAAAAAPPLRIGSVKTNVGHLEAAAGMAGLIKVALALRHRQLPPSLHFQTPNPHIPFETLPLRVQTQLEAWPAPGERALAGVSSFGFGGTNAHAVLAGLAEVAHPPARPAAADPQPQLLLLSARAPDALRATARRWQDLLAAPVDFAALAYTAARRQTHLEQRLALVAASPADAREALGAFLAGEPDPRLEAGQALVAEAGPGVVFVCPGQGGQWLGMARELYAAQPAFRRSLDATARALRSFVEWDLPAQLLADEPPTEIDVVQPLLFALSVAFAALWQAEGVTPSAVIGHSLGEVAAAHIAGALSLEDAARVICIRSRLLRQISSHGLMAAVELTAAEAQAVLAGREAQVALAAVNGPRSVVFSGEPAAVEALLAQLEAGSVFVRRIQVDVASHSPQVDALREPLLAALAELRPQSARLPLYSTVTGARLAGPEVDAAYWADNLRQPVLFGPVAARLQAEGAGAFIELGPHPVLLPALGQLPPLEGRRPPVLVASQRRGAPEWPAFLAGLGRLYAHGLAVDWAGLFAESRPLVTLPAYPWQRERYWLAPESAAPGGAFVMAPGAHPLLGGRILLATSDRQQVWQNTLTLAALPYLGDHRVQVQVLFPAAAYLEMALAAGAHLAEAQPVVVEQAQFQETLPLPPAAPVTTQFVLTALAPGRAAFQVAAQRDYQAEWTQHAQGFVRLASADEPPAPEALTTLQARLGPAQPAAAFYAGLAARGLPYGPAFQRVAELWAGAGEALARLTVPDDAARYRLHPALLDGAFQSLSAAFPAQANDGRLFLPAALDTLWVAGAPAAGAEVWCHARLSGDPAAGAVRGDLTLFDATGRVFAAATGLHLRAVGAAALTPEAQALSRWFYRVVWEDTPLPEPATPARAGTWLLFIQPETWSAALAERFRQAGRACVVVSPGAAFAQRAAAHYELSPAAPAHFRQLFAALEAGGQTIAGVVYGWRQSPEAADVAAAAEQATVGALHLAQVLAAAGVRTAPRLYLLTGGLAGAPLAGLAGTLLHEHPDLRPTTLRLDPAPDLEAAAALVAECLADTPEMQVALTGGRRAVARLLPFTPTAALAGPPAPPLTPGQPMRLRARRPGLLDSLALEPAERPTPAAGEVVIQVEAAGLNFLDLLAALGTRPDAPGAMPALGLECAGRVAAVGAGVTNLQVGDAVVALAPAAFATFAVTRAQLAARKPAALDWAAAATLPIAFLTAHYALHHVACLQRGERVLIHSAASGTGLAAVQVAQWLGAEVYATAGSAARREQLRALGIRHVFGSRTLAFAEEIRAATADEGIDVVLNSLAGEAIPAGLALLRPRGRFVELGKRDIYALRSVGLYALRRNLALAVVDLASLAAETPAFVGGLLAEVLALVEQGVFQPLPREAYALADAGAAFRRMAQAQHHGKVVLTPRAPSTARLRAPGRPLQVRPDGTYLITGGLGAIGRRLAAYLVEQGARHLLLVGRGAPSPEAQADVAALEAAGAAVHIAQADVASLSDLQTLLARFQPTGALPPLRGIFHAAGVLDDGVLLQQTAARFAGVFAPKVAGSWNLHQLSLGQPLEAFVLFSSAAALIGAPGQGNYAAANAFMDELAAWRQAQGLPALSVQWGPWAEIGLAARPDRAGRLSNRGFAAIQPDAGLRALHWALAETDPVLAVLPFDVRQWRQSFPQAAGLPLLAALAADHTPPPSGGQVRAALLAAGSAKEQRALLEAHLRREIAEVLRIPAGRIGPATALDSLGFDSLLALELRNRLELGLAVRLSATLIWNYPTVSALAGHLASVVLDPEPEPPTPESAPAVLGSAAPEAEAALLAEVTQLSDDEVLRELMGGDA
ncbi:MAG: SDR family NAD(P)-dependent oxidoreductase [Anaerolineales bacterium]|nr:SDR family NAD(P)-dependent oxidoreductase [Anaerolineales bacterium]